MSSGLDFWVKQYKDCIATKSVAECECHKPYSECATYTMKIKSSHPTIPEEILMYHCMMHRKTTQE